MAASDPLAALRAHLLAGQVIPAHPLALGADRRLDERHQRALTRYYVDAGTGGIAVAVHTTQFAIRDPGHGLLEPVLTLASETADARLARSPRPFIKVAGVVGPTGQAVAEAHLARAAGYDAALVSLAALGNATDAALIEHCRALADVLPLFGFYLQPAVGGRPLSYAFWRAFAELPQVLAIKIAPFNRYQTLDVVRAVADAGRDDVALYTGNDDSILVDLLTPIPCPTRHGIAERRITGGLLGQWAVWTHRAVEMLHAVRAARGGHSVPADWLRRAAGLTIANAAIFDVDHGFAGCIAGIHEVLRRSGLMRGIWCLDPAEGLSPGQREAIDLVWNAYPELRDDDFIAEHRDDWLR